MNGAWFYPAMGRASNMGLGEIAAVSETAATRLYPAADEDETGRGRNTDHS